MSKKDYIIRFPGKPLHSETLKKSIKDGSPKMPRVNFCSECGSRFTPGKSRTLCKDCFEKKESEKEVVCQICGKKLKVITNTHLKIHGVTRGQYKRRFKGAKMRSSSTIAKMKSNYNTNLVFEKRKKQLEENKIKYTIEGELLVYGKGRPYIEEKCVSKWQPTREIVTNHYKDVLSRGGVPSIMCEPDINIFNSLKGFDFYFLSTYLFKVKYAKLVGD